MTSKYKVNQCILFVSIVAYCIVFSIVTIFNNSLLSISGFFISTISLHYILNMVHIGSHNLLSRNRYTNELLGNIAGFFGGVTFADFKTTHLLHHRFTSIKDKDPDFYITKSGPIWSIPFKIFYHDVWFWEKNLWKKNRLWYSYIITRILQVSVISILFLYPTRSTFMYHWLLPMLVLGLCNALFLFYLPHYSLKIEAKWKQNPTIWNFLPRLSINISRAYHEKHHDNIRDNINYFPLIATLKNLYQHKRTSQNIHLRYTDIRAK